MACKCAYRGDGRTFAGSNFEWTLPASQVAKQSDQGSPWQLEYETQSSTTHQRVAVRISPPSLKWLNYLLLARSEITCHLIITSQKSIHSGVQHNIFELALTPDDEDSSHSFGEIKLQTIQIYLNASTCKEWNKYLNETDLTKYQLSSCCTSGLWNCPSH